MNSVLFAIATILVMIAVAIFASVALASIRVARKATNHSLER
jgi:type II secretory pathway component PulJ